MLSNTAEYALRAMVLLAQTDESAAILGRDIATVTGVPQNYLAKILLDLKKAGLVSAVRGAGGGYRLNSKPDAIYLIDIVEIFDHERAHPKCLLDFREECTDHSACTAHEQWKSVRTRYVDFLRTTSLADVSTEVKPPKKSARSKQK